MPTRRRPAAPVAAATPDSAPIGGRRRRRSRRLSPSPSPPPAQPTPTAPSPAPAPESPPLSPAAKKKRTAALWARDRLLRDGLEAKDRLNLPRGFSQAGLRFDKKGLTTRARLLKVLVHPDKHATESEAEKELWTEACKAIDTALAECMGGLAPTPRRPAPNAGGCGRNNPLEVLDQCKAKADDSLESVEYSLSGTHAVMKKRGTSEPTPHERILIVGGFLNKNVVMWYGIAR